MPPALSFCLFYVTPLGSRLPGWSCWERWLTRVGRKWLSASAVANHISHGCHSSFLNALAKACWKSLRWPPSLEIKPQRALCTQAPSALHSRPCHVTIIPNHVSFGQPGCTRLGKIPLVRVRSVWSRPGLGGGGQGELLWDLSDRLSHGLWMCSKRDSMAVRGCEVTPNPAQLPTSC